MITEIKQKVKRKKTSKIQQIYQEKREAFWKLRNNLKKNGNMSEEKNGKKKNDNK